MILKKHQTEVKELSLQANLQAEQLQRIRHDVKSWKWEAFGRPESLVLAFLSGFAIAGGSNKDVVNDADNATVAQSPGKNRALQAVEASLLAWRVLGRPVPSTFKDVPESEVA